jgi:alkylhydroperoxidase family enzyme
LARISYPSIPEDGEAGALVARILDERGSLLNLYKMLLHNPGITEGWLRLGTAVTREVRIDDRTRELVILAVSASCDAEYEWDNHEPPARRAGLTDAQLTALRQGDTSAFDERDRAVLEFTDVLGHDPASASDAIAKLRPSFDDREIYELAVIVGFYWMVTRLSIGLGLELES